MFFYVLTKRNSKLKMVVPGKLRYPGLFSENTGRLSINQSYFASYKNFRVDLPQPFFATPLKAYEDPSQIYLHRKGFCTNMEMT